MLFENGKKNKFSFIFDETTISTTKSCGIVVKYYDPDSKTIQSRLLDLANIFSATNTTGATGGRLYEIIIQYFDKYEIPKEYLIGFASDGASNITGKHNSLTRCLTDEMPGITILKCICHSVHLCSSQAAKCLPHKCEYLVKNIHNHFSHNAKRIHIFKEFQDFCNVKPHKLHVCQTRWLSYHAAVKRLLEQWEPLKLYYFNIIAEERLHATISILDTMNEPSTKLYYTFRNLILPKFNQLNLLQKQGPTIQMYLGSEMHCLIQSEEYRHNKDLLENVFSTCKQFLIIACK
nr:uncharacterized protein LOC113809631 [Penaeus vannamei]